MKSCWCLCLCWLCCGYQLVKGLSTLNTWLKKHPTLRSIVEPEAMFSEEIMLVNSTHSWPWYHPILKFSNHIIIVLPNHLMKEQSSFTCHTTKGEKISKSKILAHLFQKYKKTIHIHKTEGSPEHSLHLRFQWRRELVTTYDCQTAAAWDPSPPMQQPGGVARLTRSARIGSLQNFQASLIWIPPIELRPLRSINALLTLPCPSIPKILKFACTHLQESYWWLNSSDRHVRLRTCFRR